MALRDGGTGPINVAEGAFDALGLLAAGVERTVAIFGKTFSQYWDWTSGFDALVIALDPDASREARELARSAILHGRRASILPAVVLGGAGDIAEAWAAGTLAIGDPAAAAVRAAEWSERAALRAD